MYRVYFENNVPLFTEFYADKAFEVYPVGM
jgi:hypothetical protein